MKDFLILSTIILFGFSAMVSAQAKPKDEKTKVEKKTFEVKGMTCQGCVSSVEKKLGKIEGVKKHDVSLEHGEATVEYDSSKTSSEKIVKEFEGTPYNVTAKEIETE